MAVDPNSIKHCFQLLAHAEPQIYERLIRLCDQYAYELMVCMVTAPQDNVLTAQGQAKQAMAFMKLMTEKPTA